MISTREIGGERMELHWRSRNMKTLAAIPCHDTGLAIGSVVLKARKYVDEVLARRLRRQ